MNRNLLRFIGLALVLLGTGMSVYFDNTSVEESQLEKVGYILFFIGLAISIKARSVKSDKNLQQANSR